MKSSSRKLYYILLLWLSAGIICMIFGVAITDSRLVAAPTGIDSLWQKAADIAAKNWNLVPGYTIRIDRMLDRNGKVSSVTEVWIKHTLTDSLTIENTIVKALVDSQEVPEAKYDQFRQFTHQDIRPDNKSLFHNTPPDNPLITRTNEQREIDKRLCIGYKYEYRVEDDEHGSISQSGMAWIDKATGTPIYLEFVADNLPRVVKSMDGCAVYSFDPTNEKWWLEKTVTNMEIRMFFVTRKMQSEIRYKDYWEYPGVK